MPLDHVSHDAVAAESWTHTFPDRQHTHYVMLDIPVPPGISLDEIRAIHEDGPDDVFARVHAMRKASDGRVRLAVGVPDKATVTTLETLETMSPASKYAIRLRTAVVDLHIRAALEGYHVRGAMYEGVICIEKGSTLTALVAGFTPYLTEQGQKAILERLNRDDVKAILEISENGTARVNPAFGALAYSEIFEAQDLQRAPAFSDAPTRTLKSQTRSEVGPLKAGSAGPLKAVSAGPARLGSAGPARPVSAGPLKASPESVAALKRGIVLGSNIGNGKAMSAGPSKPGSAGPLKASPESIAAMKKQLILGSNIGNATSAKNDGGVSKPAANDVTDDKKQILRQVERILRDHASDTSSEWNRHRFPRWMRDVYGKRRIRTMRRRWGSSSSDGSYDSHGRRKSSFRFRSMTFASLPSWIPRRH